MSPKSSSDPKASSRADEFDPLDSDLLREGEVETMGVGRLNWKERMA